MFDRLVTEREDLEYAIPTANERTNERLTLLDDERSCRTLERKVRDPAVGNLSSIQKLLAYAYRLPDGLRDRQRAGLSAQVPKEPSPFLR